MQSFLVWLDDAAVIDTENKFARWLERIAFFFLILMILFAPHSIAATQSAWLAGMFAWAIRLFMKPRPKFVRTRLDVALWAFFGWTALSAVFSYAPDISLDKLRNPSLFLIFYFIVNLARTKRAVVFLTLALVFSCMANVVWTPVSRLIGRGVQISGVKKESPLTKALVFDGDTLLEVNKKKIRRPEDLIAELERNETVELKSYRPDYNFEVTLKRADLLAGEAAPEKLGIGDWRPSRVWRSSGFYGHYVTYAEVLQLLLSLTFGLFIASLNYGFSNVGKVSTNQNRQSKIANLKSKLFQPLLFGICVALMTLALLLTVTRAAQISFLVSAAVIVILSGNRKIILPLIIVVLPIALGGMFFLQQSRNIAFFDAKDNSILWRETVYREGWNLATANARHALVGVGMDSIRRYAEEWHLFDDGRLPKGHFHSTPLQIIVERGFPALGLWIWGMFVYGRLLWRKLKAQNAESNNQNAAADPQSAIERGIILGSFGGLIGFLTSGAVHYNYGDAVVAMMFFIIMGLSVKLVLCDER